MASLQGRQGEYAFASKASGEGLVLGFPSIEHVPFDYFLWNGHEDYKIQVKSTLKKELSKGIERQGYKFGIAKGCTQKKIITAEDCDFVVCFIIPENIFYIIPIEKIDSVTLRVFPNREACRWANYKEAWHLLKEGES